jgi:hypothetical protein
LKFNTDSKNVIKKNIKNIFSDFHLYGPDFWCSTFVIRRFLRLLGIYLDITTRI